MPKFRLASRSAFSALLAITLFLTPHSFLAAAQDGANGIAGDPGSDGQDGSEAVGLIVDLSESNADTFTTADGGDGGNGGAGVDGADPDQLASGGSGGDGGNGGHLRVFGDGSFGTSRTFQLLTGDGGNGGRRGSSIGPSDKVDGNGGAGGDLEFNIAANKSINVSATAGAGGTGIGYGQSGGAGGSSFVDYVHANESVENISGYFKANVRAGQGGLGLEGADGGDGGGVRSNSSFGSNHHFGGAVIMSYFGGSGGKSFGGTAGRGGDAELLYSGAEFQEAGRSHTTFDVYLFAGDGGDVSPWLTGAGEAGDGGDARINSVGPSGFGFADPENARFSVLLQGGNGGNSFTNGNGGHGGIVELNHPSIISNSSKVEYSAVLRGGNGGSSVGGQGGDGGSIELNVGKNQVITEGVLDSRIYAYGGNGGEGPIAGNGGNVVLDTVQEQANQTNNGLQNPANLIHRELYGGHAGSGGLGGYVDIYESIRGDRPTNFSAFVAAGQAEDGTAGFAKAYVTAIDESEFSNEATRVSIEARGRYTPTLSRVGTDAQANALSRTTAGPLAYASSVANAGRGSVENGNAFAVASADNFGNGAAVSQARAVTKSVAAGVLDSNHYTYSKAVSESKYGTAEASARSTAYGHFSAANSIAYANTRQSGNATAVAETQSSARKHSAAVSTTVSSDLQTDAASIYSAQSNAYFRRLEGYALQENPVASTSVWVESGMESLFGIEQSALVNQFDFADPTADVFSSTHFEVDSRVTFEEAVTIDSGITISQELMPWEVDHDLSVFFYDVAFEESNLENLYFSLTVAGQQLIDQEFADVFSAAAFLDEAVFDLGSAAELNGMLEVDFYASMELQGNQEFSFRMGVVGAERSSLASSFVPQGLTAVPEPTSTMLFGLLSLPVLLRRKR